MTAQQLKTKLFAFKEQYTQDLNLVQAISALELPVIGNGLTGGSYGTSQPYTDHAWGNNVIRICKWGIDEEKPSVEVLEFSPAEYKKYQLA